jgi:hypothetical protein
MSVAHPVRSISLAAALTGGLPSVWPFQHIATTTFGWPSEVTFGPICSRNRPRRWAAVKVAAAASLECCSGKFAGTGGAGVRDRRSNFHVSHAFRHSSGLALWSRPSFSARRRVRAAACFCMTNSPATKSSFRPYFLARNPARFCVGKLRNNIFVATRNVLGTGGLCL